jgi:hypothetical protein
MNYLPMDPSEMPGTPEYEELRDERLLQHELWLELWSEQMDRDSYQYPYRFGS